MASQESNVPKVSADTRQQWAQEITDQVQRKLAKKTMKADWEERLEAAARSGAMEERQGAGEAAEKKEKKHKSKHKHKHKEKDKDAGSGKVKHKTQHKRHKSSSPDEAEQARKKTKKGRGKMEASSRADRDDT